VGDIRVTFQTIPYQTISIVGRQSDSGLSTFTTSNGGHILLVERGSVSAEDMFQNAREDEQAQYFFLLFLMSILLLMGTAMTVNAFSEFGVRLPFFGDFAAVTGALRWFVPFILVGAIVSVIIGISWLAHQHRLPIAIPLLCGGLGLFYLIRRYLLWAKLNNMQAQAKPPTHPSDIHDVPCDLESNDRVASGSANDRVASGSANDRVASGSANNYAVAVHYK
jgi:hypothetical protein